MWSYAKALAAIEGLGLAESNFRLAHYWLSLWSGDAPPARQLFDPAKVPDLLPGIGIGEVRGDGVPFCRLSGTAIDAAACRAVTGTNLLDYVPRETHHIRIQRLAAIVAGGLSVSRTEFLTRGGERLTAETVQLPFFGFSETGARQFLAHVNWRPGMGHALAPTPALRLGYPETFIEVPIA